MSMLKLTNSFHDTSVTVRAPKTKGDPATQYETYRYLCVMAETDPAARRRLARVRKALCGQPDCTCGTVRP